MAKMKSIKIKGTMVSPYEQVHIIVPIDRGELFIMPTDTIWGLGVCITYPDAIKKLFRIKGRPLGQPLVLMPADISRAEELIDSTPSVLFRKLANNFWPGPLTIIVRSERALPEGLYSEGNRIGLRIPDHAIAREIISASRERVLAVTSANRFRQPDHKPFQILLNQLGPLVI